MTDLNDEFWIPPSNGTPTSDAAASKAKLPARGQRRKVFEFIFNRGEYGATRDEIQDELKMLMQSVNPRVWELAKHGWVVDTDATRITRAKSPASVVIAIKDLNGKEIYP